MPTDWEHLYQQGDTGWNKGAPAPPLLEWLERAPLTGNILVPGCGFGHDVRALAGQPSTPPGSGGTRVVGFDLSPTAVEAARQFPSAGGETYRQGDLFALPKDLRGYCDWVFEHTCFCAIDPGRRPDYVRAVATALKPGGHLLAIFYLTPNDPGEEGQGPPFNTSERELDELFHAAFELRESYRPTRFYKNRAGRELVRLLRRR